MVTSAPRSLWAEPRPTNAPARRPPDWALVAVLIYWSLVEVVLRQDLAPRLLLLPAVLAVLGPLMWRRRLAQESITNARRHARHATQVTVAVTGDADRVRLIVDDDGSTGTRRKPLTGVCAGQGQSVAPPIGLEPTTLRCDPGALGCRWSSTKVQVGATPQGWSSWLTTVPDGSIECAKSACCGSAPLL
jgi:hypothetical protein